MSKVTNALSIVMLVISTLTTTPTDLQQKQMELYAKERMLEWRNKTEEEACKELREYYERYIR